MKYYEAPAAHVVSFAPTDVIAASRAPDTLNTWGVMVDDVNSNDINLFG